jgi:hypothetical protein
MTLTRDPISEWFDGPARRLLERAYANRDGWTGVYLSQPSARQRAAAGWSHGIWDLGERDRWGEVRWVRAFKRSVYYQLGWYGRSGHVDFSEKRLAGPRPFAASLQWETGNLVMRAGWPASKWAIRVSLHDGGAAAARAAGRLPAAKRWQESGGRSTASDRDWA